MGVCHSSNNKTKSIREEVVEDKNLNYEWAPDDSGTKENSKSSISKINAFLYNYITDNTNSKKKKVQKILVCKYLFFDQYGKLFCNIPRRESKEIIKIEGSMTRQGDLKLKRIEEKVDCTQITNYEGKLSYKIGGRLQIEGLAKNSFSKAEDTPSEAFNFSLDFPKDEWIMEYTLDNKLHKFNIFLDLNDNENHISSISGISLQEDKGVSLWKGVENEKKEITLTQQYIEDVRIASDEQKKFFYQGVIDRIVYSISGIIQGKDMDGVKFKMSRKNKANTNRRI